MTRLFINEQHVYMHHRGDETSATHGQPPKPGVAARAEAHDLALLPLSVREVDPGMYKRVEGDAPHICANVNEGR